jgi:uncharacterized membrane protein YgcG
MDPWMLVPMGLVLLLVAVFAIDYRRVDRKVSQMEHRYEETSQWPGPTAGHEGYWERGGSATSGGDGGGGGGGGDGGGGGS